MPIIPSGKKRIMQAQSYTPELTNPKLDELRMEPETQPMAPVPPVDGNLPMASELPENKEKSFDTSKIQDSEGGSPDIQEYIFKFLEGKGYPPRRLSEFEQEFVQEKIYPGNTREITLTLPDRYYGTKKRLEQKDLDVLFKDMSEKFNLVFVDGERKDKKCTINFSTQKSVSPEEQEQEASAGDDLEEIFGAPKEKKTKPEKTKKVAKTMNELLKESNDKLINTLLKHGAK